MKRSIVILVFAILLSHVCLGQQVELVDAKVLEGSSAGKSYVYMNSVKITSTGSGFHLSAAQHGAFFIRPAEALNRPSNIPPSLDQNFVRVETSLVPSIKTQDALSSLSVQQFQKSVSYGYLDGLGRKSQDVTVSTSPEFKDVVVPYQYDSYGRMPKEYLSYVVGQNEGAFRVSSVAEQSAFYNSPPSSVPQDSRPFKENIFEASPLKRVTDIYGPGELWKNGLVSKGVKSFTRVNVASDNVIRWKYYSSGTPETDGTYPANHLSVEETVDEEGQVTRVFKDLRGQTVLNRVGKGSEWFDTHYIYSPSGLLMLVIQPEGVARLATEFEALGADKQSFLNRWCFQYQYDREQRVIAKRIPGWEPEYWSYTVYDKWNRIVLTQSPTQKLTDEWLFTKYDRFNRPIMTGICNSSATQATLQDDVNTFYTSNPTNRFETESGNYYTQNTCFPLNIPEAKLLTLTYYDNYDFLNYAGWEDNGPNSNYQFANVSGFPQYNVNQGVSDVLHTVKGFVTGTKVRALGEPGWLNGVNWYDKKYRVVQTVSENYVNGRDRITTDTDFTGRLIKSQVYHASFTASFTVLREFTYDHAGRLIDTYHQVNDSDMILLYSNKYNELGQLVTKKLYSEDNGNTFKQHVDYRYNIRGWLTRINDSDVLSPGNQDENQNATLPDLFGMNLLYNEQDTDLQNDDLYNGNISAIKWSNNLGLTTTNSQPKQRAYSYTYDPMNRLKSASHFEAVSVWNPSPSFHENNLNYDLNGNILSLNRTTANGADMDVLTYDYGEGTANRSNKLRSVSDYADATKGFKDGNTVGNDYEYDANGNMVRDRNKDIESITYNHLNLPYIVRKTSGDYIKYIYDATGMKLRQEVYNASDVVQKKTDYIGEFIYEDDALQFINQEEGRIIAAGEVPEYQYHLKDHLGNVRLTFTTKEEVEEATATLETAHASEEQGEFLNYAEARKIDNPMFDHTDEGGTFNAVRLMGGNTTETYGLAKSLSVMPGDVINMEVYAKYLDPNPANWSAALLNIIQAIAGTTNPGGTFVDGGAIGSISGPFPYPGLLTRDNDTGDGPKAYLNYIIFDREFNYVNGGFRRVSTAAREAGQGADPAEGISHEHLFLENITITEPGYVYIYLSNENETPVEVFFDDFRVEHIKSPVVQMDDYYPFGLTYNSYQRENSLLNRWRFQGQEHVDDLNLGWDSFKWRNHQPEIGRFFNVDPLAEKYYYNSVYAFSENKVVAHIELEGLESLHFTIRTVDPISRRSFSSYDVSKSAQSRNVFRFTYDLTNKSVDIDRGNRKVDVVKGVNVTQNEDGSTSISGVLKFKGVGSVYGELNSGGYAAFSFNLTDMLDEDGSINIQSNIVGENKSAVETILSGTENGELDEFGSVLLLGVPNYYADSPNQRLFRSDIPDTNEGGSNVNVKARRGDSQDISIDRAMNSNDKIYQLLYQYFRSNYSGKDAFIGIK